MRIDYNYEYRKPMKLWCVYKNIVNRTTNLILNMLN